jgi:histidinol-phosphatase
VAAYDEKPSDELQIALEAVRAAADISRHYYAGNFTVTTKADLTPVTQADVECEQAIRKIILERFPEHGFFGEETGRTNEDAEYLWLVDPIDGAHGLMGSGLRSVQFLTHVAQRYRPAISSHWR